MHGSMDIKSVYELVICLASLRIITEGSLTINDLLGRWGVNEIIAPISTFLDKF